jgi:hypothetical protein
MDLKFILYIFLSIVLVTGGAYSFYSSGQELTASLFFVGSLGAVIFFGLRWFTGTGRTKPEAGAWPPVINYCPDFLTLHVVNNTPVCIDTIGVAQSGGISRWSDPTQTDTRYLFNLYTAQSGEQRVKSLCDECSQKKVTWEGVWDGTTCVGREPPPPPASAVPAAAGPSGPL